MTSNELRLMVHEHELFMPADGTGIYNRESLVAIVYEHPEHDYIYRMSIVPTVPDRFKNPLKTLALIHDIKWKYLGES